MDRVTLSAMVALKEEVQNSLEALGKFPKAAPFDHGVQVGVYHGLCKALEVLEGADKDEIVRQDNL